MIKDKVQEEQGEFTTRAGSTAVMTLGLFGRRHRYVVTVKVS